MNFNKYSFPRKLIFSGLLGIATLMSEGGANAQIMPSKSWDKTFGGTLHDNLYSIKQTNDGGYILGGTSRSGISGDKSVQSKGEDDFWVIKTDASGNKLWDKGFGGNSGEELVFVTQTSDGGFFLAGSSLTGINGDKSQASRGAFDFWVIKLDATGVKQWDKAYGGNGDDILNAAWPTSDGGYILAGTSNSNISGEKSDSAKGGIADYWLVKIDALGNKQWDKTFGGDDADAPNVVKQTSDGGYIVAGVSLSGQSGNKNYPSKGDSDGWIIKLDATGLKQWERVLGGLEGDGISSLLQTSDGGYIFAGESWSNISGDKSQNSRGKSDYWLIKTDAVGIKQWDKTFGGDMEDERPEILQTPDGGYLLAGTTLSSLSGDKSDPSFGGFDFWLVKTDASGNKQWDKVYGGNDWDSLLDFQRSNDGGYILAGFSTSSQGNDKSQPSQGMRDFWVLKLGGTTTGSNKDLFDESLSIYPNPSQGKFRLQLNGLGEPTVLVTVSDLIGHSVVQQKLTVTGGQISQELALPVSKGVYLLQLNAGSQTFTHKIVVE